jgi:hypothetical protein
MNVGIAVTTGVEGLRSVDTALLADLGFSGVFVSCYEDEARWHVDDLAAFIRRAKTHGLEPFAVPCGYGRFLEADPSVDSLFVHAHPATCQVDSRGRRLRKACPNHPKFLEWFSSSMRTLAWMLECRGFLWNEPAFYHGRGTWSCRCPYCLRLFQAAYGREMPHELTDEVLEFRRNSVVVFLLAAAAAIQSVDRRLTSLVLPAPALGREHWHTGAEDLERLASCSGVDGLCAMVPWQEMGWDMEFGIREAQGSAAKAAHRHQKACPIWVTASPQPGSRTVETVEFAARLGVDALVLSDHDSLIEARSFRDIRSSLRTALHAVH